MFKPVAGIGDGFRYLIFPILHNKHVRTRGSDHWTVIVLDMVNGDYIFITQLSLAMEQLILTAMMHMEMVSHKISVLINYNL